MNKKLIIGYGIVTLAFIGLYFHHYLAGFATLIISNVALFGWCVYYDENPLRPLIQGIKKAFQNKENEVGK